MANLIPQGGVFQGLDRLNQALDQRYQNAMAMKQMQESQRRNALVEGYAAADQERKQKEFEQKDQLYKQQELTRNAMIDMFSPKQTGGPLMAQQGQDYEPVSLRSMQPTRQNVIDTLFKSGDYGQALKLMPEPVKPDFSFDKESGMLIPTNDPTMPAQPVKGYTPKQDYITTEVKAGNGTQTYYHLKGTDPTSGKKIGTYSTKDKPGMSLEVGPDGTVRFSDGATAPLSKGTTAKTEQDILDTSLSLQKLNGIQASFKPEFLTIPEKLVQGGAAAYEKMGGKLTPQQKKSLTDYTEFRMQGMELLNSEIKRMTGAAVTKQEEPRLRASMPDPQNDSPTQYKMKFEQTIKTLKLANARYNYALRKGVAIDATDLDKMPSVINRRGQELEIELGKQIKDKNKLRQEVQLQLAREFGI